MGTSLTGTEIKDTYDSLLKISDNGPLSGTAKYLSDGLGNDSVLALSTAGVGIGTTTPTAGYKLDVAGRTKISNAGYIADFVSTDSNASAIQLYADNSNVSIVQGGTSAVPMTFFINAAERMRITSDGLVGIGTSSPSSFSVLSLAKNGVSEYASVSCSNSSSTATLFVGVGGSAVGATALRNNAYVMNVAASDLILGTGDFERMRITSAGSVGIGTDSPSQKLSVASTGVSRILVQNTDNQATGAGIQMLVSNAGTTVGNGTIRIDNTDNMSFFNSGGERLRIQSGGGISFNGDTAAANALDDYEEGTWTMSVAPSTSGTITLLASVNQGRYTKIGRLVMVQGLAEVQSVSSPIGTNVTFSGLPFAIPSPTVDYDSRVGGAVSVNTGGTNSAVSFQGFENSSSFNVNVNASTIATASQFYFSFTYTV